MLLLARPGVASCHSYGTGRVRGHQESLSFSSSIFSPSYSSEITSIKLHSTKTQKTGKPQNRHFRSFIPDTRLVLASTIWGLKTCRAAADDPHMTPTSPLDLRLHGIGPQTTRKSRSGTELLREGWSERFYFTSARPEIEIPYLKNPSRFFACNIFLSL